MSRSRNKLTALYLPLVIIPLLMMGGCQSIITSHAMQKYPPPGKMVDVGGRKLQLNCQGTGSPTVVFQTPASPEGSLAWFRVQPDVSKFTRTCSYSHAGIMWSDPAPGEFQVDNLVNDLHTLLENAGEQAPFILVGQSRGGLYNLIYTGRYGNEVAGLVFVDSAHPDQLRRFQEAGIPGGEQVPLAIRMGSALRWTGLVSFVAPLAYKELKTAPAPAIDLLPKSLPAFINEQQAKIGAYEAAGRYRALGNRPVIVLSKDTANPPESARAYFGTWAALQADIASWSSNSELRVIPHSGHNLHIEHPDVVTQAIRDVIAKAGYPR